MLKKIKRESDDRNIFMTYDLETILNQAKKISAWDSNASKKYFQIISTIMSKYYKKKLS